MNQPELGLKIAELRNQKGLTQEELVEQCNINVRSLQRIESGVVTPRKFTLNLIFSCLDYELKESPVKPGLSGKISQYFERLISGNFIDIPPNVLAKSFLKPALVGAIFYFFLRFAIIAISVKLNLTLNGDLDFLNHDSLLDTIRILILTILLLGLPIAATLYFGGFVAIGNRFKNHVLTIASLLLIFSIAIFSFFHIISVFSDSFEIGDLQIGAWLTFGTIGILFGIGIFRLKDYYGRAAKIAGVVNVIEGIFRLTLILGFIGEILSFVTLILEITVLYKAYRYPQLFRIK